MAKITDETNVKNIQSDVMMIIYSNDIKQNKKQKVFNQHITLLEKMSQEINNLQALINCYDKKGWSLRINEIYYQLKKCDILIFR